MKYSPLFWPIELKGRTIYILDETLLPHKLKHIKIKDYKASVKAIKEMKTRAVGQVLLVFYTFLLEIKKYKGKDLVRHLETVAHALSTARPTLPLKFLTDMVLNWARSGTHLEKVILGFLEGLKAKRVQQAKDAAELLSDHDVVLTHCNVSGLLPLIAEFCLQQNKHIGFFVTETRPYLQGMRLTAWELQEAGVPVTIIADNMVAHVMSEGMVTKVVVGADHLALNGDIANKVGTYQIALLAKNFNIPFYVLCPPPSHSATGKDVKIEIRPDSELFNFCGINCAPKKAKGYYPAFDITPNELITKHIYLSLER